MLKSSIRNSIRLFFVALVLVASTQAWAAKVYKIGVNGLACPFCAYGVERNLKALPGVKSLGISINSGIVTVTMRDGATLSKSVAGQAVKRAGFTMRSFR